ncbi:hypothetical protein OG552_22750 [Streptomyces sp. NBC_01476]|uniref:hypothetical protein n=1 Tax=Streptomyces sp. NBC_01476 TaxID=2903881 RepID=UPI002E328328|nr:hypothetical protein [Streptomyces sp. NBC_01476]
MSGTGRTAVRTAAGSLAVVAVALLAGCGIRSTTVPVDAGPAPSRMFCAAPRLPATPPAETVIREVYLVCTGMQVASVQRDVTLRDNARLTAWSLARELITQLQISPRADETKAGFRTTVPGNNLFLLEPQDGDPKGALRLSEPLDELPSFALAQIVCTLTADALVAPEHAVVLGGPDGDELRRYTCTSDLRTRPEAADSAGTVVH